MDWKSLPIRLWSIYDESKSNVQRFQGLVETEASGRRSLLTVQLLELLVETELNRLIVLAGVRSERHIARVRCVLERRMLVGCVLVGGIAWRGMVRGISRWRTMVGRVPIALIVLLVVVALVLALVLMAIVLVLLLVVLVVVLLIVVLLSVVLLILPVVLVAAVLVSVLIALVVVLLVSALVTALIVASLIVVLALVLVTAAAAIVRLTSVACHRGMHSG